MQETVTIVELTFINEQQLDDLSRLLLDVVEDGASIGFLPPLSLEEAASYWKSVIEPGTILWAAYLGGQLAGSVQLQLAMKRNAAHRAEIAKLMVHPYKRRNGIARKLMNAAHDRAIAERRTLLVLDTRAGDPSNLLYQSLGYKEAGQIPRFARSASGELDATVIYYRETSE
ncbi:GNAT family N-acetyltransferase [Paenibacillus soyae]|uniref:GNAT family N-acetyltransferase n=1 Tax=Paenibacillus soyae TaxID=2969249 RepID=A0A9X2MP26_9BACL|nr:GNAT family N-acetyltransferase [Paenibacillus soyae]MCR2805558.1 GNAT family N-acetyltransferase [Paenibacillus soyae]